jgi:hypothetical protein
MSVVFALPVHQGESIVILTAQPPETVVCKQARKIAYFQVLVALSLTFLFTISATAQTPEFFAACNGCIAQSYPNAAKLEATKYPNGIYLINVVDFKNLLLATFSVEKSYEPELHKYLYVSTPAATPTTISNDWAKLKPIITAINGDLDLKLTTSATAGGAAQQPTTRGSLSAPDGFNSLFDVYSSGQRQVRMQDWVAQYYNNNYFAKQQIMLTSLLFPFASYYFAPTVTVTYPDGSNNKYTLKIQIDQDLQVSVDAKEIPDSGRDMANNVVPFSHAPPGKSNFMVGPGGGEGFYNTVIYRWHGFADGILFGSSHLQAIVCYPDYSGKTVCTKSR